MPACDVSVCLFHRHHHHRRRHHLLPRHRRRPLFRPSRFHPLSLLLRLQFQVPPLSRLFRLPPSLSLLLFRPQIMMVRHS